MATSPDLELRLGSLSIDESEEDGRLQAEGQNELDLNKVPAPTPLKPPSSHKPRVGLVYSEQMMMHAHPKGDHPEQPARISVIYSELKKQELVQRMIRVAARNATDEELETVHTKKHVTTMKEISKRSYGAQGRAAMAQKFNSIYFNEGSSVSSLIAAGSVVEVAVQVAQGKLDRAAAVVRPPGHHAEADKPMGFCLYNNVAVAARWLVHQMKLVKRVLIIDWDVHHGNGTQHMFYTDPSVLYFSPHRFDFGSFYPCSEDGNLHMVGEDAGAGYNVNVPWPWGSFGDADYLEAWDRVLLPIARQFDPEIVLVSAGFDAAKGDPLGECNITPYGYSHLTHKLLELAGGKLVLALEGGYNLDSISKSYAACTSVLLGDPPMAAPPEDTPLRLSSCTLDVLNQVRAALAPYWDGLHPEVPIVIESVEIIEVKEVTEVPPWARETVGPAVVVVSPSERDLGATIDGAPVEDLAPSSVESEEYFEASEVIVVELERTLSPVESAGPSRGEQASPEEGVEPDPRDVRIAALEEEVRRLKELNLKLQRENGAKGGFSGSGVRQIPVQSGSEAESSNLGEASSSGKSHQLDTSKFGFKILRPGAVKNVSEVSVSEGAEPADAPTTYVWYASFGSNLWEERFMCYIRGGKLGIMGTPCAGTSDPAPPTAKETFLVPRRLFFGHKSTARWGEGGVAFLMPKEVPGAESTVILRAYRITLEQFNEVVAQENRMLPQDMPGTFVTESDLHALRTESAAPPGLAALEDRWYGNILYLGDHDGEAVLTFTCSQDQADSFLRGAIEVRPPSKTYKQALVNGLMAAGLTLQEAELYVDLRGSIPLLQGTR